MVEEDDGAEGKGGSEVSTSETDMALNTGPPFVLPGRMDLLLIAAGGVEVDVCCFLV